jgi:hypothetical protein
MDRHVTKPIRMDALVQPLLRHHEAVALLICIRLSAPLGLWIADAVRGAGGTGPETASALW